jgi:hypothetical protein
MGGDVVRRWGRKEGRWRSLGPGREIRAGGDIMPADVLEVEHTFRERRGRVCGNYSGIQG